MSISTQAAKLVGQAGAAEPVPVENRQKLADLAAEFESMLLMQMVREMSESGKWSSPGENGLETLGAETFDKTFQLELSRYLAKSGGVGLSPQLLKALDAMSATSGDEADGTRPGNAIQAVDAASTPLHIPPSAVTSAYGWRHDPFTGRAKFHKGVDLRAPEGSEVRSAGAGKVKFAGDSGGYGTNVVVEHANGVSTRYAHLSELLVRAGDEVGDGQLIGLSGQSGRATAAHLHFEVLEDGVPVDPLR